MSSEMEKYLKRVDNLVKENLKALYELEQKKVSFDSKALRLYKAYHKNASKKSSLDFQKKNHDDKAKEYDDQINKIKLETHTLHGELVQRSGELLRLAQQGFKTVYSVIDREKSILKGKIKSKHGDSSINSIGSQNLDEIDLVWNGRNQSVHVEDGLNPDTKEVFGKLKHDFPKEFDKFDSENKAYEVVKLLGWLDIKEVTPEEDIDKNSPGYQFLKDHDLGEPLPEPKEVGYDKFRELMLRLG